RMRCFKTELVHLTQGAAGLRKVNELSFKAAHTLAEALLKTGKVRMRYPDMPYLNEFAVETVAPLDADTFLAALDANGITGGIRLTDNAVLIAATEMCSPTDIELYVKTVETL
ncbi:MAG: hypothetical protein K2F78_06695, partial [Muribaculaceae bacterium]|nr:hypothetical protein [Muribaculaceae bacterium]